MTDHDSTKVLLPWYVSGRLDAASRDRVERHVEGCPDCGELLEQARRQAAFAHSGSPDEFLAHVEPSLLTQYAERPGTLEPHTIEWIEAKLRECSICREAYERLREVEVYLDDRRAAVVAPEPRESLSARIWRALATTVLRPAPALVYLLVLAFALPLWWVGRDDVDPVVTPARVLRVSGQGDVRDTEREPPPPLVVPLDDTSLLFLETGLAPADVERLDFTIEMRRGESVVWSRVAARDAFELREGRAVFPVVLTPGLLEEGVVYELSLRVRRPGDALDGQPLFRRSLRPTR